MKLTETQIALLRDIAADNITWRSDISGRRSFRKWSSEHAYTTVTPRMLRLQKLGLFKTYHGSIFGRGGVELTAAGKEAIL